MTSKNDYKTFLLKEEEQPRLAVLQRFKDINRVMTDTYLKKKRAEEDKTARIDLEKGNKQLEYTNKMIQIMKEMQSPKKFNSPMQRRNLFG